MDKTDPIRENLRRDKLEPAHRASNVENADPVLIKLLNEQLDNLFNGPPNKKGLRPKVRLGKHKIP